jgi:hypothetical protein
VKRVEGIGLECVVRPQGSRLSESIGEHFHPEGVIYGHFLDPNSDDAAVSGWSMETHPMRGGGTLLLTRQNGQWKPQWYKSALITNACEKVTLADKRDLLICEDEDGGMGHTFHELYVVDLQRPADFQHNPPIVQAHSFNDGCIQQQQTMGQVRWMADKRSFSVAVRTTEWTRFSICADLAADRPPAFATMRFRLTAKGVERVEGVPTSGSPAR